MKPKWLGGVVAVFLASPWAQTALLAATTPALTPLSLSTSSPTASPTPWPTHAPVVAPTWAPMSAGPAPEQMKPKKPSPWMSSVGLGLGIPQSSNLQTAYTLGFDADVGSGFKVTDQFSVWMDIDFDFFNSKNDSLTNFNNYTLIEAAFWARYRILSADISPYVFAGPGLAYNEYRSNLGAIVDSFGNGYIPYSYEIDFLAEGGLGLEMRVAGGLTAFLQGKLTYDFPSSSFAGRALDNPTLITPLELGMIFGI